MCEFCNGKRQKIENGYTYGNAMIVNIDASVYTMNRKGFIGVLKIASKAVKFGIYAVVKDDKAIMLNEKYEDIGSLKNAVAEYKRHGFKVYWNENNNDGGQS